MNCVLLTGHQYPLTDTSLTLCRGPKANEQNDDETADDNDGVDHGSDPLFNP